MSFFSPTRQDATDQEIHLAEIARDRGNQFFENTAPLLLGQEDRSNYYDTESGEFLGGAVYQQARDAAAKTNADTYSQGQQGATAAGLQGRVGAAAMGLGQTEAVATGNAADQLTNAQSAMLGDQAGNLGMMASVGNQVRSQADQLTLGGQAIKADSARRATQAANHRRQQLVQAISAVGGAAAKQSGYMGAGLENSEQATNAAGYAEWSGVGEPAGGTSQMSPAGGTTTEYAEWAQSGGGGVGGSSTQMSAAPSGGGGSSPQKSAAPESDNYL